MGGSALQQFLIENESGTEKFSAMSLTSAQLRKAVTLTEKIEELQAELASILGGSAKPAKKERKERAPKKGKRTMSPEAREKIAAAQRKRWAATKKAGAKESR